MDIFCRFVFALLQTQSIKDVLKKKIEPCIRHFFQADFPKGRCQDGFYTSVTNAEPVMTVLIQGDITNIKGQTHKLMFYSKYINSRKSQLVYTGQNLKINFVDV